MARILAIVALCACLMAMASAQCLPWTTTVEWKGRHAGELGVYRMCGDSVCGNPIRKLGKCSNSLCPHGARCNDCSDELVDVGSELEDLPQFYEGKEVGRYGFQFDGETCPFHFFGSDFRVVSSCTDNSWFSGSRAGWITGCKPRVSCRTRGGKRCRGKSPFDVAMSASGGYTSNYYGLGNAVSLDQCIAGTIGGGVPFGEKVGVDC